METPKEYYYTYYSYEEWGRGYFGSRGCKCLPEEDIKYFGSSRDKTFKPTQKIILKYDYATREEAYADEIILHDYYDVANNPHFANRANATSTKFYFTDGSSGGKKAKELCVGVHSLTTEQLKENGRKGGNKVKELGVGLFGMSEEEKRKARLKGAEKSKQIGAGLYVLTFEERSKTAKKTVEITNSQKWECCITGYISTAAGVVSYQKGKGIDTSKENRKRVI
jgi:hypothetical protein